MAGLSEKIEKSDALLKEIQTKRQEFKNFMCGLQKECKHEIVVKYSENQRICYICKFWESWNLSTGFVRLGEPLMVLTLETADSLTPAELNKLVRRQIRMPEFLKKYFGE